MDKSIVKNSAWLLGAQGFTKVVSFFYVIFLARSLGVSDFGYYITAQSYFSLVSSLGDLGVGRFLLREISLGAGKVSSLLFNAILFRFTTLGVFFIIFFVVSFFLDPDITRRNLAVIAVLAVLPQTLSLSLDSAFIAISKVSYSAIGLVFLSLVTTASGVFFLSANLGSYGAVIALLIGQIFYAAFLFIQISELKISWIAKPSLKVLKEIALGALPYGVLTVLGLLYFKVDALLLSYLKGAYDVGIYGAAYKFLEAIVFVPSAIVTALFPYLAKLHGKPPQQLKSLYFKSMLALAGLSLPIFLGFYFILPELIKYFLPNYLSSVRVLMILSFTIPFMFVHVPGAAVLLASNKYLRPVMILSLLTLSFNIALNLLLIPQLSFIGSAWATVFSEALSFLVFFTLLQRRVFRTV